MFAICCASTPDMLLICHAIGIAVATVPTSMCPVAHNPIASAPVPTINSAFIPCRHRPHHVPMRCCARQVSVCSSTASRTNASSSRERANSLTVRILV